MAIQKDKSLDNGVSGNYWKIAQVIINKIDMHAHYQLCLYLDQAHADQGQRLGCDKDFTFEITKDQLDKNMIGLGYDNIKAMDPIDDDLKGGQDV